MASERKCGTAAGGGGTAGSAVIRGHATDSAGPEVPPLPAEAAGPAIKFDSVSLELGGTRLLDGVNLRWAGGAVHCLVGPNGAGKTSLLRCVLGQAAHTGRVELHWPAGGRGAVGYVPQTLDFDRTLPVTAEDFLALIGRERPAFLGPRAERRAQIAAALAAAGLADRGRVALGKLSGGELKRLLLAQAIEPRPALLVLDEPMNHLDAPGVALALRTLGELRRAGTTIVCALHDLAQARALADTVTGLHAGRAVFSGAPAEVLTAENVARLFAGGGTAP
jgi:zinc transport system ATP-binding protein